MIKKALLVLMLSTSTAFAQAPASNAPDPAFMQRAITALQTQRNSALDAQALSEAKLAGVIEDLNKANTRIKELEAKKSDDVQPDKK